MYLTLLSASAKGLAVIVIRLDGAQPLALGNDFGLTTYSLASTCI